MNAKEKLEQLKKQTIKLEFDGIDLTFAKKNMLWLMNSGKMPSPISNSLIGVMGAKDTKAINSVFEIYEILKKLAIDPDQETLTELFEYWDTAKVLKLFNLYSYAINTGKSTVNEAYLETVEEVNAEAKN